MPFVHSKQTRVLVNEVHASSKLKSITIANTRALGDSTAFTDEGNRFVPGLRSGTLSLDGMFEDNTLKAEIEASEGVDNALLVSAGTNGFAIGSPIAFGQGDLASNGITSTVSDVVGFSIESTADELVDLGVSLHDLTAEAGTLNGAAVDNAALTTGGGVAVLHVTANTRDGASTFKVQHSVDNSVWVDLVTFAAVGASSTTSERKAVTGTVNRYLRATWAPGGTTGSITFMTAFARR